ncbi:relaxin receptor 2 [Drosophila grimshawi]|uniref:GH18986 n=1 Tax=Drosophila grimshawi TaxID=7222 RepID=B4JHT9_DROGR|nr:relaxin receptor 2 [Drosophila grimshawi]EDV92847.1 GH18986 [Drosophila grimshawi]
MVYGRSIAVGVCFMLIVILISALIFYLSLGPCPTGSFACNNGIQCVPQRQMCDKHLDCSDGSDENPVECGNLYGSKELADKIVRNAIEKKKQQQQLQRPTIVAINASSWDWPSLAGNGIQTMLMPCAIITYPRQCQCRGTMLYCGRLAKLRRWPRLSEEVTNLFIIRNNVTLRDNLFANLTRLQKLTLKYNNISHLPPGSLSGLPHLERFELSHNNISRLPHGILKDLPSLQWLFLVNNQLRYFPMEHLASMHKLEWLVLSHNRLTLRDEQLSKSPKLVEIYLENNRIEYIGEKTFAQLDKLELLDLRYNLITHIHEEAFVNLSAILDIRLIGNPIKELSGATFLYNTHLEALSLAHMPLAIDRNLLESLNVSFLNLTGIEFDRIDFTALNEMRNLKYIVFERFYYCSMTPQVLMCKPKTDGVSSFKDLLSKPSLRYSTWLMATLSIGGNLMVLWGRFIYRDENVAVTMVIRNLALADMLMGFYLLIIGVQDYRYRDEYHKVAREWLNSWQCKAIGTLAVSSSEVSMLILAFMSVERFLLIADPFRGHRSISVRIIYFSLLCIWLTGVGLAVTPVVIWYSSTQFYGTHSGTCFPLLIHEAYPLGWQYSAFVFLGVNLWLLVMIALLYTALLISIWRTRSATPLSLLDCEFAVRFFFIVLTDVLCWAPIIAMKIWVFFKYNISDDIYAWLVVFILPLNSAVNPLLYTFTTPKYRNQILLRGWKKITSRKRTETGLGNVANTTTGTATGSSQNPDDYTTTTTTTIKAMPLALTMSP